MTDITDHYDVDATADGWRIDDESAAQWALRRLAADQVEADRVRALHGAEAARLDAWRDRELARLDGTRLRDHLADWYRRRVDDGHTGPIRLPSGRLSIRRGRMSRRIVDTTALIDWCRDNAPDAVTESVSIALLPKPVDEGPLVTPDGEIVPGVEVARGDDSFVVALTSDGDE